MVFQSTPFHIVAVPVISVDITYTILLSTRTVLALSNTVVLIRIASHAMMGHIVVTLPKVLSVFVRVRIQRIPRANGGKCYDIDGIIRTISDCENDISLDQNFNVECVIPKHGP